MAMNDLFSRTASTMFFATSFAFNTGKSQANLVVKDWNIPVDILLGQMVVKWMFSLAPLSWISLSSDSMSPTTANFEALSEGKDQLEISI